MKKCILSLALSSTLTVNALASTITMDSMIFSTPERHVDTVQVGFVDTKNNVYKYVIPNGTPSFTVKAPAYPYSVTYREDFTTPQGKMTWTTTCTDETGGYNNEGYLFEPSWDYYIHFTQPEGNIKLNPNCYTSHS